MKYDDRHVLPSGREPPFDSAEKVVAAHKCMAASLRASPPQIVADDTDEEER